MKNLKKDLKHALKAVVLLATILMTTAGAVGTTYADDTSTIGLTTAIASTSRDNKFVGRPDFDDLFFRPRFDPFFRSPFFFNPFFDFDDFEDDKFDFDRFDRFDRDEDD